MERHAVVIVVNHFHTQQEPGDEGSGAEMEEICMPWTCCGSCGVLSCKEPREMNLSHVSLHVSSMLRHLANPLGTAGDATRPWECVQAATSCGHHCHMIGCIKLDEKKLQ